MMSSHIYRYVDMRLPVLHARQPLNSYLHLLMVTTVYGPRPITERTQEAQRLRKGRTWQGKKSA